MADEYYWSTFYDSDDLVGRVLWYGNQGAGHYDYVHDFDRGNVTKSDDEPPDAATYIRAVLGFMFALLIYFCALCYVCDKDREVTKREVDRSIITKRVLPHGQGERCQTGDSTTYDEEIVQEKRVSCFSNLVSQCCCSNQKQSVHPVDEILEDYRAKSRRHHVCAHCNSIRVATTDDELEAAEEGVVINNDDITCNICIEAFHVGEKVAWSKAGGDCKHVFHYDCILPWAVLGHVRCPVCRETFWKRDARIRPCGRRIESESAVEMRQSTFCVRHGLQRPISDNTADLSTTIEEAKRDGES